MLGEVIVVLVALMGVYPSVRFLFKQISGRNHQRR